MKNIQNLVTEVKLPTYCDFCYEQCAESNLNDVFLDKNDPSTRLKLCKNCKEAYGSMNSSVMSDNTLNSMIL